MSEKNGVSLAQEMCEVSALSFYLSPDEREGHTRVFQLYCHFRKDELKNKTVESVFGVSQPAAPIVTLPEGHRPFNPVGLSTQVWVELLKAAFAKGERYLNMKLEIRDLLKLNARVDTANFEARINGEKSKVIPGNRSHPSLLRSFLFEGYFPHHNNQFFIWLLSQMATEFVRIAEGGFKEASELEALVTIWDTHFSSEPFIPSGKQ